MVAAVDHRSCLTRVAPPKKHVLGFLSLDVPGELFDALSDSELAEMGVANAFLLDTHALVWTASDPDRLGRTARELTEDPATVVYVTLE